MVVLFPTIIVDRVRVTAYANMPLKHNGKLATTVEYCKTD